MVDVMKVVGANFLTALGMGDVVGMAAVPNAVFQKYSGSYVTFIKGAALVEETAVAKGIRRITAVTKGAAKKAIADEVQKPFSKPNEVFFLPMTS